MSGSGPALCVILGPGGGEGARGGREKEKGIKKKREKERERREENRVKRWFVHPFGFMGSSKRSAILRYALATRAFLAGSP